jgi:hypothetical protein
MADATTFCSTWTNVNSMCMRMDNCNYSEWWNKQKKWKPLYIHFGGSFAKLDSLPNTVCMYY